MIGRERERTLVAYQNVYLVDMYNLCTLKYCFCCVVLFGNSYAEFNISRSVRTASVV